MNVTKTINLNSVPEIVVYAIRNSGLSQTNIARKLDVSSFSVSAWSHGRAMPNAKHFIDLLEVCGFDIQIIPVEKDNNGGAD